MDGRKLKKYLGDSCIGILDKLPGDNRRKRLIIECAHILLVVVFAWYVLFNDNQSVLYGLLLIAMIEFSQLYFFHGCLLTYIEKHLTDDNYTIIDPFIPMTGIAVDNSSRYYSTIASAIGTILFIFLRMANVPPMVM